MMDIIQQIKSECPEHGTKHAQVIKEGRNYLIICAAPVKQIYYRPDPHTGKVERFVSVRKCFWHLSKEVAIDTMCSICGEEPRWKNYNKCQKCAKQYWEIKRKEKKNGLRNSSNRKSNRSAA